VFEILTDGSVDARQEGRAGKLTRVMVLLLGSVAYY
jgi:hypothetical protein